MAGNRRTFLKTAGFTAAALAAAPIGAAIPEPALAAGRSFTSGRFALELDGAFQGFLASTVGGEAFAEVIEVGALKQPGLPQYEDITVEFDFSMASSTFDWMKACMDGSPLRKSGALISADFNFKELSRLDFSDALISEIGFPALDAASKDGGRLSLEFSPDSTRRKPGSGAAIPASAKVQKKWFPANFRLKIDGLEAACTKVNKIEALVVKQKFLVNSDGGRQPGRLEYPNLVVTLAESAAGPFFDWAESFIIQGANGQKDEKSGSIDFLTLDLKTVLATLTFSNLGIFRCAPEKAEAGVESIRRVKAEMYCESMTFSMPAP